MRIDFETMFLMVILSPLVIMFMGYLVSLIRVLWEELRRD